MRLLRGRNFIECKSQSFGVRPRPDLGPKAQSKAQPACHRQGLTLSAPFPCMGAVEGLAFRPVYTVKPLEQSFLNFILPKIQKRVYITHVNQ
jgi:hypothetical protein